MSLHRNSDATFKLAAELFSSLKFDCGSLISSLRENKHHVFLEVKPFESFGDDFSDKYLAFSLLSKYPHLNVDIDRKAVAIQKFLLSEDSVKSTERLLGRLGRSDQFTGHPVHSILHAAEQKIHRLLGPFNWDMASRFFAFGPGASIGVPRVKADAYHKYGKLKPSVTADCLGLAIAAICRNPLWLSYHKSNSGESPLTWFNLVKGNKVSTVPKNAKTDRIIATEPQMNMFIQKGIGRCIRHLLKKVKIDLDFQESNQRLALEGSLSGSLATLDLSAASDSISLALVRRLLPSSWVEAIELTRSPYGVMPSGEVILYRKVSSMGNGYTFELQSLIFWAICSSVVEFLRCSDPRVGVYGDDLIVSTDAVPLLIEVLSIVGFKINDDKSFWKGGFRESCGKHYFNGEDVTPLYLKDRVDNVERYIWFANSIRDLSFRRIGLGYGCDSRFRGVYEAALRMIPRNVRSSVRGPLWLNGQLSTTCIGMNFDEVCPRKEANGFEGYRFRSLSRVYGSVERFDTPGVIRWLHSRSDQVGHHCDDVSMTEYPTRSYRLKTVRSTVQRWADPGPWVPWT